MRKEDKYTYLINRALDILKMQGVQLKEVAEALGMRTITLYNLRRNARRGRKLEWDLLVEKYGELIEDVVKEEEEFDQMLSEPSPRYSHQDDLVQTLQEMVDSQREIINDLKLMIKEREEMIDKLREENEALKKLLRQ